MLSSSPDHLTANRAGLSLSLSLQDSSYTRYDFLSRVLTLSGAWPLFPFPSSSEPTSVDQPPTLHPHSALRVSDSLSAGTHCGILGDGL